MPKYRSEVVKLAKSWVGLKESDGSYKKIIDIYNSYSPLPRGVKMDYSWAWCAATWSALAIALGYTDIMPIEMSCGNLITLAKAKGIWVENDAYVPSPADAVLYDWDDDGKGDNTGWPDHIGTVISVGSKSFDVVEGNYSDSVKIRTMEIDGRYIRGFIVPKYDEEPAFSITTIDAVAKEVIAGKWGNGEDRKKKLTEAGYDYEAVQKVVNQLLSGSNSSSNSTTKPTTSSSSSTQKRVDATGTAKGFNKSIAGTYLTTTGLNVRNEPTSTSKSLVVLPKSTPCYNFGYYTDVEGTRWLFIQTAYAGIVYTGFCSSKYLKKK